MAKAKKASSKLRLKKIPTSVYLEKEQVAALDALAARTRVGKNAYMREGLDMVLAKYKGTK